MISSYAELDVQPRALNRESYAYAKLTWTEEVKIRKKRTLIGLVAFPRQWEGCTITKRAAFGGKAQEYKSFLIDSTQVKSFDFINTSLQIVGLNLLWSV